MANEKKGSAAGHGFFELIEFSIVRNLSDGKVLKGIYGVNVAKVREVIRMPKINKLSSRLEGVEGVFELRGIAIPAINLAKVFGDPIAPISENQQIIITEFSNKRAGFIVDTTHRIKRIQWKEIMPPASDAGSFISGMTLIDHNEFLFILDLERILEDLESASNINRYEKAQTSQKVNTNQMNNMNSSKYTVLVVDDSPLMLHNCCNFLLASGFNVISAQDGQVAKDIVSQYTTDKFKIDAVITDIEMPRMSGIMLTKWIKENDRTKSIPVILRTSLMGETSRIDGEKAGADDFVLKNDLTTLLNALNKVLQRKALVA